MAVNAAVMHARVEVSISLRTRSDLVPDGKLLAELPSSYTRTHLNHQVSHTLIM